MSEAPDNLPSRWARAGAMFSAEPAPTSPDLERLLLDTARASGANPRLFIMASTWLARYGDMIYSSRLADLIRDELEPENRPAMGLLLDHSRHLSPPPSAHRFADAIDACTPAKEPRPLFEVERMNPTLRKRAEQSASPISRRWNLWARAFEPKFNALRPTEWIIRENPGYRERMRAVPA